MKFKELLNEEKTENINEDLKTLKSKIDPKIRKYQKIHNVKITYNDDFSEVQVNVTVLDEKGAKKMAGVLINKLFGSTATKYLKNIFIKSEQINHVLKLYYKIDMDLELAQKEIEPPKGIEIKTPADIICYSMNL